jgi:hypothetical protein
LFYFGRPATRIYNASDERRQALGRVQHGDPSAADELLPLVYQEL